MFGLLVFDALDDALTAWGTLAAAAFWDDDSRHQQSACAFFAGIAAWRKGDAAAAGKLFSDALDVDPGNIDAQEAELALSLGMHGMQPDPPAGEFRAWWPQSWIVALRAVKGAAAQDAMAEDQQRRCDAHVDYLSRAAETGGPAVRYYAIGTLKMRARSGDEAATAALRGLLTRPCGPDKVRIDIEAWLKEHGLAEAGAHAMLVHGVVRELELIPARLHERSIDIGLPPALQSRLEQMHHLLSKHDVRGALRIAEILNAARPDHPVLIGHVATLKAALGEDLDRIEALFRHSAELDPDYFFARIGLARVAVQRGDLDRAKALLAPLRRREEYHVSEWRALLMADHAMAEAEQDMPRARALMQAIETLG
jgi:tetratricopeptide (TPR) repeat protein